MSRYGTFTRIARDQRLFAQAYWNTSAEGGGSILLEDGAFVVSTSSIHRLDLDVELHLGEGALLEVRDGLTPNVQLTLPDGYVEALGKSPTPAGRSRRLYWSSSTPPRGLDDPSQNPYGEGDLTLYVPESLEPAYRERGSLSGVLRAADTWKSGMGTSRRPYPLPTRPGLAARPSSRPSTTPGSGSRWRRSA